MTYLQPFFDAVLGLKTVDRAGWSAKAGIKNPESVADHTFSMCAVGMVLSDMVGLDTGKVLRMTILHDLAESVVGDYMPGEVTAKSKMAQEKKAMKKSCHASRQRQGKITKEHGLNTCKTKQRRPALYTASTS